MRLRAEELAGKKKKAGHPFTQLGKRTGTATIPSPFKGRKKVCASTAGVGEEKEACEDGRRGRKKHQTSPRRKTQKGRKRSLSAIDRSTKKIASISKWEKAHIEGEEKKRGGVFLTEQ